MNIKTIVFLAGCILAVGSVQADPEFTAGASIGTAKVEFDDSGISFDGDDLGWKVFGTYMFTENWGIEGGYIDFGEPDDDITLPGFPSVNAKIDASGFELLGVGRFAASDNVDLFGKLGFVRWDADISASVAGTGADESDDGTDVALGFGGIWRVSDQFGIRGEVEWFNIEDTDKVWMLSVGGQVRF